MPVIIKEILPDITNILFAIAFIVRGKEIIALVGQVLSSDNGRASSRRLIANGSAYVFFRLSLTQATPNPLTMYLNLVMTFLCLGLATLPQLMKLWMSIKGLLFGQPDKSEDKITENSMTLKSKEVTLTSSSEQPSGNT